MNQPTEERIRHLEEEQKRLREEHELLKRRLEQRTEEMRAINVNVASADVERQLDNHTELLREISQKQDIQEKQLKSMSADVEEIKLDGKAYTGDAAIFKNKVEHIESDVSTIKTDVDTLKTDVGTLKTDIDTVNTRLDGHAKYFEEHGRRLNQMATKDDIAELKALMMQLLQQKPPES